MTRLPAEALAEAPPAGQVEAERARRRIVPSFVTVVLTRVAWGIPVLLCVSFLIFALMDLAPGDLARQILGDQATEEQLADMRAELGLDRSLPARWWDWLGGAVHGDFGVSLISGQSVGDRIQSALAPTLSLALLALGAAVVLATAAGCLAALRPDGVIDRLVTLLAALGITIPSFWLALVLINLFAIKLGWLPAVGYVGITDNPGAWLSHLVLPTASLTMLTTGELARYLRGTMRDELEKDYVLAARLHGLPMPRVVFKHALKNAAIPVVTVIGLRFTTLLGGTIIVEQIFAIRGMGWITVDAVLTQDYPVVLGVVVVATTLVLVVNTLVDLSYSYFNPKLRKS